MFVYWILVGLAEAPNISTVSLSNDNIMGDIFFKVLQAVLRLVDSQNGVVRVLLSQ